MTKTTAIKMPGDAGFQSHSGLYLPRHDINQWLRNNIGKPAIYSSTWGWKGKWYINRMITDHTNWYFYFFKPQDAMLFKMTWVGQ